MVNQKWWQWCFELCDNMNSAVVPFLLPDVTEALWSKKNFLAAVALSEAQEKSEDENTQEKEEDKSHHKQKEETNEGEGLAFRTRVRHHFCPVCLSCSLTFSCRLRWGRGHRVCAAELRFLLLCLPKAPLTRLERTRREEKSTLRRCAGLS